MADFNVEVIVDPTKAQRGSRQAIKSLGQIENASDRLRSRLGGLFGGLGVGLAVSQIVQLTDAYTNLQNRLRVVTNGQQELVNVTEELFQIAQRTRSSFEGSAELYSRLALATRDLGTSQKELTQFTESMNKAIILSGASGREANAGLIQLSQGIASGALRGDELRSVLEQLPVVADVIAKQMGVTRGELRAMGAEGAITADIILKAFAAARDELSDRFGKTIPTISQSFQVLRNSLVKTIGAFNNSNGAAKLFSVTLISLANNMETVLRTASAVAITIGTVLAVNAIPKAITAIKALTAAMVANPIGILAVGLAALISYFITFGDQLSAETGKLATFHDVAVATWSSITAAFSKFINFFQANFGFIGKYATEIFQGIKLSLAGFLRFAASNLDQYVGFWIGAYHAILIIWNNFPDALNAIFRMALNGAIARVESGLNAIIGLTNKVFEALHLTSQIATVGIGRLGESADKGVRDTGAALRKAFEEGFNFNFFQQGVSNILDDAENIAKARKTAAGDATVAVEKEAVARVKLDQAYMDLIKSLDQEIALLKMSATEREIQTEILKIEKKLKRDLTLEEDKLVDSRLREIQALTLQNELYEQITGPIEEYKESLTALNTLLAQGKINQDEFNMALQQTQLGGALNDVRTDLMGETDGELAKLQDDMAERQMILDQAFEARLLSEQEYLNLSLEANQAYNNAVRDAESQRFSMQLAGASTTFKGIADLTKAFTGGQSKAYKILFGISKAFALADAGVQIANAIAKAANTPWPANIAAIAQVGALTSGVISQIQSANFAGGFQNGGDVRVGGSGGPDSQLISLRASPNETISVKTPGQRRQENQQVQQAPPEVNLNNINVFDPSIVQDYMESPGGEQSFINNIQRNAGAIKSILGDR